MHKDIVYSDSTGIRVGEDCEVLVRYIQMWDKRPTLIDDFLVFAEDVNRQWMLHAIYCQYQASK
jgi:hypothetical protein